MWNDFLNYLRDDNGELSAFWMTYVDVIQDILLGVALFHETERLLSSSVLQKCIK